VGHGLNFKQVTQLIIIMAKGVERTPKTATLALAGIVHPPPKLKFFNKGTQAKFQKKKVCVHWNASPLTLR